MIGSRILPTGVVPLTSVITKLCFGENTSAEIAFRDGKRVVVDASCLDQYVTERGNPGNAKNVTEVDVHVNSSLLSNNVAMVDTPGVGSTYARNTFVAYDFPSRVDAALFVFGVDPPISQMELEFLNEVRKNADRTFLVQNKMDMLDKKESEEALRFSESVLRESLRIDSLRVFAVSAKLALEARESGDIAKLTQSGYPELERELRIFLTNGKAEATLSSATKRVLRVLSDLSEGVKIEQGIISKSVMEVDEKVDWLQREVQSVRRRLAELESLVDGRVSRRMAQFTEDLDKNRDRAKSTLVQSLDDFLRRIPADCGRRGYVEAVQRYIAESIERNYGLLLSSASAGISEWLKGAIADFSAESNQTSEDLESKIAEVFGITKGPTDLPEIVVDESRFYFDQMSILKCESILPADLPMILPKSYYRRSIGKRARKVMIDEIEKHAGRIRYDVDYRLSESARRVKHELRSQMLSSIESIEGALRVGLTSKGEASEARNLRLAHLTEIEGRLNAVAAKLASTTR
ncbi:MAG: dynamin family protein [Thermoplasmata archaeon]